MTITWNAENAQHLYDRTGFGATSAQITAALKAGLVETVDKLLAVKKNPDHLPGNVKELEPLQGWWVNLMVKAKYPLLERLTLFWHNHFATGFAKIGRTDYMHAQNSIFRNYGLGKFRDLLTAVSKDPAMLIWLDNNTNTKGKQNQNFARELMELFTTGVLDKDGLPNYTETDVNESAKAFTGWTVKDDEFFFNANKHDFGDKTFKGQTGAWDGTDIINFLVVEDATARRISALLFGYFAYPVALSDPVVDQLAQIYLDNDTAILPVLRRILTTDEFYSDAAKTTNIKEPAVFIVKAMRALKAHAKLWGVSGGHVVSNSVSLSDRLDRMGQSLFDPPTVFGWKGGLQWVTAAGMLERSKVAEWIADARDPQHFIHYNPNTILAPGAVKLAPAEIVQRVLVRLGIPAPTQTTIDALTNYLLAQDNGTPGPFVLDKDTVDKKIRGLIALVLSSAEFQRD